MKKSSIKRILCLGMTLAMVMSAAACKGKDETLSDEYSYYTEVITSTITTGGNKSEAASTDATGSTTQNTQGTQSSAGAASNNTVSSNKPAATTSLTKEQVMKSMPAKLKGTTVTYMYWNDPKKQMDNEAIKGFEKATGCKVKCEIASYASFQEELAARITAGNAPDLVRLLGNVTWQITALQPIKNTGFNFNDTAWDKELMKDFTFNGNCYAVNLKNSAISDVAVIYYNKKALQDAEMEDPYQIWSRNNHKDWTWAKFWSMCEEFVNANNGKAGYAGATFEYSDTYPRAMGGYLYTYNSATGKFVNNAKNTATVDSWKTYLSNVEKGNVLKTHNETTFDQGKTLFFVSGPFSARAKDNRQSALKKRNRLGVVALPTDSKHQVMYEYTAFGVPKGAKNAALAPYYLRWLLDQSSYDMNKVYCSKEAKTVVDYAVSKTNRIYGYSAGMAATITKLFESGSANVKSVLDQQYDSISEYLSQENERVSNYD